MYNKRNGSTNKWRKLRQRILERDNYTCYYCGISTATHVDHITPLSKGGLDEFNNLISACQNCNLSKGTKSVKEFIKSKRGTKLVNKSRFFEHDETSPTPAMFISPKELKTPFEVPEKGI